MYIFCRLVFSRISLVICFSSIFFLSYTLFTSNSYSFGFSSKWLSIGPCFPCVLSIPTLFFTLVNVCISPRLIPFECHWFRRKIDLTFLTCIFLDPILGLAFVVPENFLFSTPNPNNFPSILIVPISMLFLVNMYISTRLIPFECHWFRRLIDRTFI